MSRAVVDFLDRPPAIVRPAVDSMAVYVQLEELVQKGERQGLEARWEFGTQLAQGTCRHAPPYRPP